MKYETAEQRREMPLGVRLRDTVTGFEGIAIAKVMYLNGCVQFYLKAKMDKDGKLSDAVTFDSQQLEYVDEGLNKKDKPKSKPTGGSMPETPVLS